jgi:hypothetical protein
MHYLSLVSSHMGTLVDMGPVEEIGHREVRGSRETFYFLTAAVTAGAEGKP